MRANVVNVAPEEHEDEDRGPPRQRYVKILVEQQAQPEDGADRDYQAKKPRQGDQQESENLHGMGLFVKRQRIGTKIKVGIGTLQTSDALLGSTRNVCAQT